MSRDPRVGFARALRTADLSRVGRKIRPPRLLPTQASHGPSGPSEIVRKRSNALRAAYGLEPLEGGRRG